MRIKNFTLMLMAVLFSTVGFAQKSFTARQDIAVDRLAKVLPFKQTQKVQTLTKQSAIQAVTAMSPQNNPAPRAAAKARAKAPEVVTPPENGEMEYYTLTGTNSRYGNTSMTVKVIWDDKDEDVFYVSGLSYWIPTAFVKGYFKDDNTVIFENGQYLGQIQGIDLYLVFAESKNLSIVDAEVLFDEAEGQFTFQDYILETDDPKSTDAYVYWAPGVTLVPLEGEPDIPVEIPKDLEYEKYVAVGVDYFEDDAEFSEYVNVGFDGKIGEGDVYIQGLSSDAPEAWVKGTFEDETTVVFRSGQMLDGDLYFVAIDDNFDVTDEYILYYDEKTGSFEEGPYAHVINSLKDEINHSVYQFRYNYEIKPITERAATPAASRISTIAFNVGGDALEFNLAKVDEEYEGLVDALLAYKLYYIDDKGEENTVIFTKKDYPGLRDEETEEIPATFTDGSDFLNGQVYLRMDHSTWTEIGIQGIYYGEKERTESKISWYTPTWPTTVTLPEGLTVTEHTYSGELYDSEGNEPFERTVGIAFDGDDMYIRGLGDENDDIWVKGTKNAEGVYVFPHGQSLGTYGGSYRLFLVGYENDAATDITVTEDGSKYTIETSFLENARYTDRSYYLNSFVAGSVIYKAEAGEEVPELVEVPEDLVTEKWLFKSIDYFDEIDVARTVTVGFQDDEVYVQGISEYIPDAWVKGTIVEEDDQKYVSFASGQYLGKYRGYDIWFIGYNMNRGRLTNYMMDYDEENFTLSNLSENSLIGINTYKSKVSGSLFEFYHTATIKKVIERAATPVKPSVNHLNYSVYGDIVEFSIPTMDTEGEGLIDALISYKLYYDEGDGEAKEVVFSPEEYQYLTEEMTVIPYGFLDAVDEEGNAYEYDFGTNEVYINMEHSTWKRIGIQTIYTGGGETNASEIGWYTPIWPTLTELPEGAEVKPYVFTGEYMESTGNVPFTKAVNVALVEDEVYIQGIGSENEETWVKGIKTSETSYSFPNGQMLGLLEYSNSYSYLFLMGYNDMLGEMEAKVNYDPETGIFTTTTEFVENADYTDNLYYWNRIPTGAQFMPLVEKATTPAAPSINNIAYDYYGDIAEINIPVEDVNGEPIIPSLLSYKFYYDEGDGEAKEVVFSPEEYECLTEEMTVIPYGFLDDVDEDGNPAGWDFYTSSVYLNMDKSTWKRIGIQSIYTAAGETNASEIGWYTPIWPTLTQVPENAEISRYGFIGTYLEASGNINFTKDVLVAKDGNDVYIQGVGTQNADTWIKGTKEEGSSVYTFSLGQFLGIYATSSNYYLLFMAGFDNDTNSVAELQMNYDEETGIFTTANDMLENATYTDRRYYLNTILAGAQIIPGDNPDAISEVNAEAEENVARYNIAGQRVGKNYKGIVVEKGKKILQK